MPVTRRQTADLSPLIKVSKKTKNKTIPEPIPASEPVPIPVPEPTDITRSKSITRRAIHRRENVLKKKFYLVFLNFSAEYPGYFGIFSIHSIAQIKSFPQINFLSITKI